MAARSSLKRTLSQSTEGYLFISPALLFLTVFFVLPILANVFLGLTEWKMVGIPEFVGLSNFARMAHDEIFWKAVWNTSLFAVGTVPTVAMLALLVAIILNRELRFKSIFRMALFVPVISSGVVVATIWKYIFNSEFGMLNGLLQSIGLSPQLWIASPSLALPSLIVINIWKNVGFYMVIYLAGLQGLPPELYDAAQIDGANRWNQFWRLTFPLLIPVTALVVMMLTIETFKIFDLVFIITRGGPAYSTNTMMNYIYEKGFIGWDLSYASAMSIFLLVLILGFSILQYKGVFSKDIYS